MNTIFKGKIELTKAVLALAATALLVFAVFSIVQQDEHNAQSLQNHTQTLTEIQKAVDELKSSNQADHAQTVKYINCVLVGITGSTSQSKALGVYQECLANAGIAGSN